MRGFLVLLLVGLFGCADSHQIVRASRSRVAVPANSTAYVAYARDGSYGNIAYPGSGALAAQAAASAFAPYFRHLSVAVKFEDFEDARVAAGASGFPYLIYTDILHWEDRATEWSGRPDVVAVKVSLVRTNSGEMIDSAVIQGKSGLATLGGDKPEDLLPKPLAEYAADVFSK